MILISKSTVLDVLRKIQNQQKTIDGADLCSYIMTAIERLPAEPGQIEQRPIERQEPGPIAKAIEKKLAGCSDQAAVRRDLLALRERLLTMQAQARIKEARP